MTLIKTLEVKIFNKGSPHWGLQAYAGFMGGFCAGVLTNPIDVVYNRQVADALYPDHLKRNYTSLIDGLIKANAERALLRGAVASGAAYGALHTGMSQTYDFLKEYLYYFFGPTVWLRPLVLLPTAAVGVFLYLPFDNIKVRLHTMTQLPNGEFPYTGFLDGLKKALKHEGSISQHSSPLALHSGAAPAFFRLYLTLLAVIILN